MPDKPDFRCAVDQLESEGLSHEEAIQALRRKEEELIATIGWVAHYVFDDPDTPWGVNVHTHGLELSRGHTDFQIVAPLAPEVAHQILANLVGKVMSGVSFWAGTTASGILRGFDVSFADATEGGRDVLRVIIPDPEGRTARGEMDGEYGRQYEGTK